MNYFFLLVTGTLLATGCTITPDPYKLVLNPNRRAIVSVLCGGETNLSAVYVTTENSKIVTANETVIYASEVEHGVVQVLAHKVGETRIDLIANSNVTKFRLDVRVIRPSTPAAVLFDYILIVMVVQNAFNLGCTMDLTLIMKHLKKPKRVLVGMVSQFGFMPVMAYTLIKIFNFNDPLSIGVLILGCAPGGGSSNWLAFMLDGDLELSIVMTFCSSCAAMGMMPAWLAILGGEFTSEDVEIPFARIGLSLSLVIVPTILGIAAQFKAKPIARFFAWIVPYFGAIVVIVAFASGIYVNYYLFFYPAQVFFCALLLPFFGFVFGWVFTSLLNLNYKVRVTICLETGIQNSVLATTIAVLSFPEPQNYDVVAVPLIAALMTALQTLSALALYRGIIRPRYGKLGGLRAASTSELLAEVEQEREQEQGWKRAKDSETDQASSLLGNGSKDSGEAYGMQNFSDNTERS